MKAPRGVRGVLRTVAVLALVAGFAVPSQRSGAAGLTPFPFAVKVLTQNDGGLGAMKYTDMAKLVYMMNASGAPARSYALAAAAGMKTVWYLDPHRIGDVPGKMSDRPPVTELNKDRDLMKCAQGGQLNSTYAGENGTVFGDPTSSHLATLTNEHAAQAGGHYGKVDYLWVDDSMLLTDQWAQAWYCGTRPPALPGNNGNGMAPAGYGRIDGAKIAYADRAPYTPQNFLANLIAFDNRLNTPVFDEGACTGDGTDLGGSAEDGGATTELTAQAKNSAGAMCENFAEGWGNNQTVNGKGVDIFWRQDLNSGIRVISAHKMFISYPYIGNEGSTSRGNPEDYDQRGYIYASFMLLFNNEYSVYKTGAWGAQRKTAAPVMVLPENLLVPEQPLATATWPDRIGKLKQGDVYVREFAACAYAGRPIGPCAAVVNPSSRASSNMPALRQTYGHQIVFTGNNGAFTGRYGTPNYGDSGDIDFRTRSVPVSLPAAGWAILVR